MTAKHLIICWRFCLISRFILPAIKTPVFMAFFMIYGGERSEVLHQPIKKRMMTLANIWHLHA